MNEQPQAQHQWLTRLVGEWTYESECSMGPDQPPMTVCGRETVRSLGGLWVIGEMHGDDTAEPCTSIITLGYDPKQDRFVGTFIASVMTHLWVYSGSLDAAGNTLTLDAEGPSFLDQSAMARYQDIVEMTPDGRRSLSSRVLRPDGEWIPFMKATYTRVE